MAKFVVTGGAGFIGSHFVDTALAKGHSVLCLDNFSTGKKFFLEAALQNKNFKLVELDITHFDNLSKAVSDFKPDWVIHFSANADVRRGTDHPRKDLDQNTIGTWNVIESSRLSGCKNILFSSTGSVYGEPEVFPTPESCPFPVQTSLYGASKLAGEGILSAYALGFAMNCVVFRFVSILGPRYTHGHVFDFIKKLSNNSKKLEILGDGNQTKSYLHINDLMNGLWTVIQNKPVGFSVYNIGHDDALIVRQSAKYIVDKMNLSPEFQFMGGERGWIGDSPRIQLDTSKLKKLGWKTTVSLQKAVEETTEYLLKNPELLKD
jgi:UDP-glucose 4-epimerase